MNPNQPHHVPTNFTRPLTASRRIAKWGGTRMFSRPAKDAFDAARKLRKRSRKIARSRSADQPIGAIIPETSAGSDLDILAVDATLHHSMSKGLPGGVIDGHLRIVCNYANEWHQRNDPSRNYTGVGGLEGPLKDGRPLFFVVDVDNDGTPYANPSAEQFWMMRYLFVPVYMAPKGEDRPAHVSLLVICPVTKTLEFLDSENKPTDKDYLHGLVGRIMQWMSTFLDRSEYLGTYLDVPQFVPEEWQFRDSRSRQQEKNSTDCGVFVLTQAQYLAFGYDYSQSEQQNWPSNSGYSLAFAQRRYRITTDITGAGLPAPFFTFFNPAFRLNQIENHQYYPILDTAPVLAGHTWRGYRSHPQFNTLLTSRLRNRRTCYVDCRWKTWLVRHCRRNLRFYPNYSRACGSGRSLKQFREWVERMDQERLSGAFNPKPFKKDGKRDAWPKAWVDPRYDATRAQCKSPNLLKALW